ncbi:MAG: sensor histidine kinase [Janthinobacterium lividum]
MGTTLLPLLMMKPANRYRLVTLGAILFLLLNTWVAAHALRKLFSAQHWLAHTLEVLTQTEGVFLGMSTANSSTRAYLLTGTPVFEDRYKQATATVFHGLDDVQQLTADNDSQQARIAILRKRISVKLGALDAAMSIKRGHPESMFFSPAVLRPALADSPDGGISVRYAITQIENEENRLLQDRTEAADAAKRNVIVSFAGATLLDLVLLVIAFQQLVRAQRDRAQLAARALEINSLNGELQGLNADLEARVAQRTRELELSNQELQAFSYSVSHDLRAPLRTIDGFSLALEEDYGDRLEADGRDYIKRVRSGVQRMGMLIDALLQLSRVTRSEVQREQVNLSQLATLIFDELRANDQEQVVTFTAQPNVMADADPRLLRVAFENLVGNALKFTSKIPEARIAFGQTAKDGETVYFIRDNGAGFDMQYVDRLFTAFQRLHGDRDFKGSGIGLATVSRIIRRHHGTIWAEGEPNHGAVFFFTLNPAADERIRNESNE